MPRGEYMPCIDIEDVEEALVFIRDLFAQGERPKITVPKKYADTLQFGLREHASWVPGFNLIAATFGRNDVFTKKGEERICVEAASIIADQIQPRFTGPDKHFHGVVILKGPIPPEALRPVQFEEI